MSKQQPVIAILGGGQLARMMVLAGVPLGITFKVIDTKKEVCAGDVAPVQAASWDDVDFFDQLAQEVDAVTFDFENVPAETAKRMMTHTRVAPNPHALAVAQDRLEEKQTFRAIGLPTAEFATVDTREDLDLAIAKVGTPAILKTRRMGYDGKGQFRLKKPEDTAAAWEALGESAAQYGLILESFVPFQREVSVVAVRSQSGEFRMWPLTQNWHHEGILSMSMSPAVDAEQLTEKASEYAQKLAQKLDYVGVLALELFVVDGELYGNEMAPRVHNSGHWTQDGAVTSQFENHVRAVADLPLGDTAARGTSVMFNWVGALAQEESFLSVPGTHWHAYNKAPRPGRKVGHANVCATDYATLAQRLERLLEDEALADKAGEVLFCLEQAIS